MTVAKKGMARKVVRNSVPGVQLFMTLATKTPYFRVRSPMILGHRAHLADLKNALYVLM